MTAARRPLGKLPARHDPRTFRMAAPLARALPAIPAAVNWAQKVDWPMWGNDRYGCCTQVGVASAIRTWTGVAQAPVLLTGAQVLNNYAAATNPPFNVSTGANDNGAVEVDVLDRWRVEGFERPGQTRDYLTAYGAVGPQDAVSARRSIAFLGGLYIGLSLPEWACVVGCGDWDYSPTRDNSIAGGHCVWLHGYDADWFYLNTWGDDKRMSAAFMRQFCDEAYGLVSRQNWTTVYGVSVNGEALDALVAEMRASAGV
ncbi:hypothetical protein [Acetobacter sp. DsW_063]|uniref:hypothetical protein n=1 Tax=Acetobacter sp. DsW_063 TaxID=1514894 RepID=UPI000A381EE0|nr:hypothetical protein [Acetobacter sp. DsW_063]OUJ14198.1 hypothetical protein HK28_00515 [Acetobacter sp. DsW_063]